VVLASEPQAHDCGAAQLAPTWLCGWACCRRTFFFVSDYNYQLSFFDHCARSLAGAVDLAGMMLDNLWMVSLKAWGSVSSRPGAAALGRSTTLFFRPS
jgi:hypothetical protein